MIQLNEEEKEQVEDLIELCVAAYLGAAFFLMKKGHTTLVLPRMAVWFRALDNRARNLLGEEEGTRIMLNVIELIGYVAKDNQIPEELIVEALDKSDDELTEAIRKIRTSNDARMN